MPAIRRRRGSAASLMRGFAGGAPFCSGGNFRTGSAIALLLSGFACGGLDGVSYIFLDLFQLGEQPKGIGRVDAVKRGGGEFGAQPRELAEQRASRLEQMRSIGASVARVAAPLDPVVLAELVDQPRQRDRLHLHLLGEFGL